MTVKRWALLEIELDDAEVKSLERMNSSAEEMITEELAWLNDSFDTVSVLWIADSYEPDAQAEE